MVDISRLTQHRRLVALAGALGAVMVSGSVALAATNFTLSISGSTTVFPSAVAVFTNAYQTTPVGADVAVTSPETANQIGQPGSGPGIADLLRGQVDVANASRPLRTSDNATSGAVLQISDIDSWVVAKDGITMIVNQPTLVGTVGTAGLQVQDLAKIYACKVTNWQQLNGSFPNVAIRVYSRETTSGTYGDFLAFIGVTPAVEQACIGSDTNHLRATGNPGMQAAVAANSNSIAYVGLGFASATNIDVSPVGGSFSGTAGDSTQPGYSTGTIVTPSVTTIDNQVAAQNGGPACAAGGCYPFGRQLFMNTIKINSLGKAGVPAVRTANSAKAVAYVNAAISRNGQQQFVNEGEPGLTTHPCSPTPACTNTLQNGVTALNAVNLTPSGGGNAQPVNPQLIPVTDVNLDRSVDITDVVLVGAGGVWQSHGPAGGACGGNSCGWRSEDVNADGIVDITDIVSIGSQWQVTWQNWVL